MSFSPLKTSFAARPGFLYYGRPPASQRDPPPVALNSLVCGRTSVPLKQGETCDNCGTIVSCVVPFGEGADCLFLAAAHTHAHCESARLVWGILQGIRRSCDRGSDCRFNSPMYSELLSRPAELAFAPPEPNSATEAASLLLYHRRAPRLALSLPPNDITPRALRPRYHLTYNRGTESLISARCR